VTVVKYISPSYAQLYWKWLIIDHWIKYLFFLLLNWNDFANCLRHYHVFVCFWRNRSPLPPPWARTSSFTKSLDHTQRRATVGRTPLDEWSARLQRALPDNTQHSHETNIHAPGGIQTHNLSRRAAADLRLRLNGHWDRPSLPWRTNIFMIYFTTFSISRFFIYHNIMVTFKWRNGKGLVEACRQ
jgi:hypothetical protein